MTTVDFASLRLVAPLLKAIAEQGYTTPTPIQAKAIPPVLEGRDLLGCAQTGTGKTAAFALPIIQRLFERKPHARPHATRDAKHLPKVLVLAPTRELATQITESFDTYGRHAGLKSAVIFGGVSQYHQVKALERGVDILVATPGRLIDLMDQGIVRLDTIEVLVLDEADRMLDMGFIQPIRRIVSKIPSKRQTLLFSATMPTEIMRLAESLLHDPVKVAVTPIASAAPKIEQSFYAVQKGSKQALLQHLLDDSAKRRVVVFTKTKHGADRVARKLHQAGISSDAIHGNKAQNRRQRTLDGFRSGSIRVLVATDVAARGLDIDDVTHVVNFDLPMEPEAYVHRIGRTGRAGATGIAISFCDHEERGLLKDIERLIKRELPLVATPSLSGVVVPAGTPSEEHRSQQPRGQRGSSQRGGRGPGDRAMTHGSARHERGSERATRKGRGAKPSHGTGRSNHQASTSGATQLPGRQRPLPRHAVVVEPPAAQLRRHRPPRPERTARWSRPSPPGFTDARASWPGRRCMAAPVRKGRASGLRAPTVGGTLGKGAIHRSDHATDASGANAGSPGVGLRRRALPSGRPAR